MKKIPVLFLSSMILLIWFISCSPAAHVEKNDSIDFSQYSTYAWSALDSQNKKKYNNSLVEQNIKDVVNAKLAEQGWKEVSDNPNVMLSYDILVQRNTVKQSDPQYSRSFNRTFYNPYRRRFYSVYYPSRFLGYEDYDVSVKEGTFTITMTDAATDKTVWQGWSTNKIETARLTKDDVQSSVKAIIGKFNAKKN